MLRIFQSQSAHGAVSYFNKELSRGDYYAEKGELLGRWHGQGAELLGISGEASREQFAALISNFHPKTGVQLTPRMREDRRPGYDFTFSAPKSVSAFYEYLQGTGRAEQAGALLDAFTGSVRSTMAELETDMRVRVRKGGQDHDAVTGNMVWAEFTHFQSRPVDGVADPHLHTHAYAMNLTHDGETWKAGQFGDIKRDATYYQEAFHARLAHGLQQLGYAVEARPKGMQLAGVERSTVEKFSRRTAEVNAEAERKGIAFAEDKARQGAATRKNKDEGIPAAENRALFMGRLDTGERDTFERIAGGGGFPPSGMTAFEGLDYAVEHCFERQSVISEKRLLAEALRAGAGAFLPEHLQEAASARVDMLRADIRGERKVTTRHVLNEERRMLEFAKDGRGQHVPFAALQRPVGAPERAGTASGWQFKREWLSAEQKATVEHVLTSSDRVIGIRGGAGTGKTATLQETVEAVTILSGKAPVILAPSSEASRGVLREEGFTEADTVKMFLDRPEFQAKARDGFIFVDEAGLMGSRAMRKLFDVAAQQNARVILQGDVRQHASVERGDALRLLEREHAVKFAELSTIRRQKPDDYRNAIASLAKGDVREGFQRLEKMGAVLELHGEERHQFLATSYLSTVQSGETALVVSPTHAEGAKVTGLIRDTLKEQGRITKARSVRQLVATNWTEAERGQTGNYMPGQVVTFHQNAKGFTRGEQAVVLAVENGRVDLATRKNELKTLPLEKAASFQVFEARTLELGIGDELRLTANGKDAKGGRLNNGSTYRVTGFAKDGGMVVQGASGAPRTLAKDFGHVAHGYVSTSHSAQGRTVDRVFIAQGSESLAASSREQFYVSASRARSSVQIVTDSKDELARAVERSGARVAASDVMRAQQQERPQKQPGYLERLKEKALELARRTMVERWRQERDSGDGLRIAGWPSTPPRAMGMEHER